MQILSRQTAIRNIGGAKRMKRPAGTPAPLPTNELVRMYERRARFNQQMAAKAVANG